MEVLFISYKYPPALGGMQKQSYELIQGFKKYAKVHTILYDNNSSLVWFFLSLYWKIPRMLSKHPNIQVIHFNDGISALLNVWLKVITNKSLAMTYHGLDLVFPNLIYQKLLLKMVRTFDAFITVSAATRQAALERGFKPEKVFAIANGVAQETIDQRKMQTSLVESVGMKADRKKLLLSIGRPVKRKGFDWFVKQVLTQLDDCLFVLIGPYPNYSSILEQFLSVLPNWLCNQLVLFFGMSTQHNVLSQLSKEYPDKFIWLQTANHQTKNYLLGKADLFIMPNQKVEGDMEGFGLVALEANVQNTLVVASRIEGITSAVQSGVNGFLVEADIVDEWVTQITSCLNYTRVNQQVDLQRFLESEYSWDKMVRSYYKVFYDTVESKSTGLQNKSPEYSIK